MSISVLILTLNEEINLPRCLQSVAWSDDIVVFDSFSTDRTVEIARDFGARVVQRRFRDERTHRMESLRVNFKHPWIFNPDADEFATPELLQEMLKAVENAQSSTVAFRLRRKDMFMGRWIRHSSLYPTWFMRLFRPEAISFERTINLCYHAAGNTGRLQEHLEHYSFNKGLSSWVAKHNRYSDAEALETLKAKVTPFRLVDCLSSEPVVRRAALKRLSVELPGRPLFKFLYAYLIRRGFLDGFAGFHYCLLTSIYEYLIVLKAQEIESSRSASQTYPLKIGLDPSTQPTNFQS